MRRQLHVSRLIGSAFLVAGCYATSANAAPPIPLHFAPGSYGTLVDGKVVPGQPITTYAGEFGAGQVITITFTGAGPMRGSIECPGGVGDGPWYGTGNSITTKVAGVCTITVGANTMATDWTGGFTMAVLAR